MATGIDTEMGPWLDTFSGNLLYSINRFQGDGINEDWELQFAGGYIDSTHIKAYRTNTTTAVTEDVEFTFIDTFNIHVTPPVPATDILVVYRDTPKATPLVNFADGAVYNERNMDKVVSQAVFVTAEMTDATNVAVSGPAQDAIDAAAAAEASAIAADASADAAAASVASIGSSVSDAAASAAAADASADSAALSETNAAASAIAADASADAAAISEANAASVSIAMAVALG